MAKIAATALLIVGTLDTKLNEILFLRSQILALSNNEFQVRILDAGREGRTVLALPDGSELELIAPLIDSADALSGLSKGEYVDKAIELCVPVVRELVKNKRIRGVVSAGGSTGSSLATAIMRQACPIGFPKLMVSTKASGDIKPYAEETDITMMHSIVDIAGVNSILIKILSNAAGAITGMVKAHTSMSQVMEGMHLSNKCKRIAVTMFGTTTPAVDNIRKILTSTTHGAFEYEIYVFHATGSGGKAMERLISEGQIDAVVDLTTTEIADELFGGVLSAGPHRLECAAKAGIPMIVSVGACDTINLGPKDTLPDSTKDKNLYYHDPNVTLMRTTKESNVKIAQFICSTLTTHAQNPKSIRVILPKGGVSKLDAAKVEKPSTSSAPPEAQTQPPLDPIKGTTGQPWHDPEADTALFKTIIEDLKGTQIEVFEYPDNINDEAFAVSVCEHLLEVMGVDPRKFRLANARRRKWSFDHGASMERLRRRNSVEIPDA